MRKVVIGIIGGTGGMGRWLAELLKKEGHVVYLAGRKQGMTKEEMAENCNVVVISVPIGVTREVIESVGPLMREDALLMDLTSLKVDPVKAMLNASKCEVVGCHPLFGPAVTSLAGQNVILCPARGTSWFIWLKEILVRNQANVMVTTPEKHDRMMSLVQVLNHLHTMHLGLILGHEGIDGRELSDWSTPVFETKMQFIKKIFLEQPSLYAEILVHNPHLEEICDLYRETFNHLETTIRQKDAARIVDLIDKTAEILWPKV
jgi:prephenate dehydrogenase